MYVIANPNPDAIQNDVNACSKVNVKSSEMWLVKIVETTTTMLIFDTMETVFIWTCIIKI